MVLDPRDGKKDKRDGRVGSKGGGGASIEEAGKETEDHITWRSPIFTYYQQYELGEVFILF